MYLQEFGIFQVNQYFIYTNKLSKNRIQLFEENYLQEVIQPVQEKNIFGNTIVVNSNAGRENKERRISICNDGVILSRYRIEYIECYNEFIYEYCFDSSNIYFTYSYVYNSNSFQCCENCKNKNLDCEKNGCLYKINSTFDKLYITTFAL